MKRPGRSLCTLFLAMFAAAFTSAETASWAQGPLRLQLQSQRETDPDSGQYSIATRDETWQGSSTAIIVCDTWDLHHCLNAVRRLEQFAPRLDEVLQVAREQGVTIIHAPSDCMEAYQDHPARKRAIETPAAEFVPHGVKSWCSVLPAEERSAYPIDQSDGGEDDDPVEHAEWRAKLVSLGRDPNLPWEKQSDLITIDEKRDFISDRGDEVWNILQHQEIDRVILTGVHTNMCVLGRPFGLRQLARNGKHVVLMRDMTDTMYNPKQWPFVSHFEGTRRIISHIERFVCPTITSDQLIGGKPFRFAGDVEANGLKKQRSKDDPRRHWTTVSVPHVEAVDGPVSADDSLWYRCIVRVPDEWLDGALELILRDAAEHTSAWCNGRELSATRRDGSRVFELAKDAIFADDANLIVVRSPPTGETGTLRDPPQIRSANNELILKGLWQFRVGNDPAFANMPLPAKFGGSADVVFSPAEPLWTPQSVTRAGEFTSGIEGPACDRDGNVFVVNFGRQGTIGKVRPDGASMLFVELPEGSIGNGIRFAPDGSFFVADYKQHNILRVDPVTRDVTVYAHSGQMNQPNDLAISPDGKTLYASDPNWAAGTGQLWRIDQDGSVRRLAEDMGTTNGIEVSPDGRTLYVNESKQRNVWAFTITKDRMLAEKRLVRQFDEHGFDGMRCDIDGNLYITRHGKGTVVKMSPTGKILREIPVLGKNPTNLCFGGADGRTIYVTEVDQTRLVSFRVDRPGRSWIDPNKK